MGVRLPGKGSVKWVVLGMWMLANLRHRYLHDFSTVSGHDLITPCLIVHP